MKITLVQTLITTVAFLAFSFASPQGPPYSDLEPPPDAHHHEASWSGTSAWPSHRSRTAAHRASADPHGWQPAAGHGPFGAGEPNNGWGPWDSRSWTDGPWTGWWGAGACLDRTWTGWTAGSRAHDAPWTTWSGCTASTIATHTYTTTTTAANGDVRVLTSTGYGVHVAEATSGSNVGDSGATALTGRMPLGLLTSLVSAASVLIGAVVL